MTQLFSWYPDSQAPSMDQAFFDLSLLSDPGTERDKNEDSCGRYVDESGVALFAVADGVGGFEGGEVASALAVEATMQAFRESPVEWGAAKRLYRAVQRANVEVYSKAFSVPELRRMATTLTAVAVERGVLNAAHVGDCRLYLARRGKITQISQDHTMVAEQIRRGFMTADSAREHPESALLLRNIGHELIVSIAKISMPLMQGDRVIVCSDGLYNVLRDSELELLTRDLAAEAACRRLIDTANERGSADNLTCAFFKMIGPTSHEVAARPARMRERLRGLLGGRS
ncbi:MAG TPA: protein phosphatase 2C domain-containing protein [Candidatus Acidoferrales bacterium]|nr:protein phosphatase 2C domain-containing protein [Candidatus Acidoferrales bacterium]